MSGPQPRCESLFTTFPLTTLDAVTLTFRSTDVPPIEPFALPPPDRRIALPVVLVLPEISNRVAVGPWRLPLPGSPPGYQILESGD